MGKLRHWYAVIQLMLLDAQDEFYRRNSKKKSGMKYEKTKVRKVKK